jgi:hypothetical protein
MENSLGAGRKLLRCSSAKTLDGLSLRFGHHMKLLKAVWSDPAFVNLFDESDFKLSMSVTS